MSDLQAEMNRVVHGFVAQVSDLARRAAVDTLESAFAGSASRGRASATTAFLGRGSRTDRGPGAKRSPADLEALSKRFAAFVKANPGLRIEQINKQLGTVTKDLALPIRRLISEGVIVAKGKKRSTTYLPGKKAN